MLCAPCLSSGIQSSEGAVASLGTSESQSSLRNNGILPDYWKRDHTANGAPHRLVYLVLASVSRMGSGVWEGLPLNVQPAGRRGAVPDTRVAA